MIEKTYRLEFLEEFLRFYKVVDVAYIEITSEKVSGIAIFVPSDPDERQEFCWTMKEEDVPPLSVLEIIKCICKNNWCDVDKITVSEDDLFTALGWEDRELFNDSFNMLFDIEIRMVDDGEETDGFFVHT